MEARTLQPGPDPALHRPYKNFTGWTFRSVSSGVFIGILVNLSNTYYGLRTGSGGQMAMISSLLGFCAVKALPGSKVKDKLVAENVLVISIATATGCMPITVGFVGIIPALEYLLTPLENGPINLSLPKLLLWSFGLGFFGIVFAAALRKDLVVKDKLPWPGPKAAAQLLSTLHQKQSLKSTSNTAVQRHYGTRPTTAQDLIQHDQSNNLEWRQGLKLIINVGIISAISTVIMYFAPILHNLPVFGWTIARKWLWTMDLSPGFFGQGMITGPIIPIHMLIGAITGWGILSPLVKSKGWAPGKTDDWANGPRGWIIWVGLAALIADASTKLTWFIIKPLWIQFWHPSSGYKHHVRDRRFAEHSETQPVLDQRNYSGVNSCGSEESHWEHSSTDRVHIWKSQNVGLTEHGSRFGSPQLAFSFIVSVTVCVTMVQLVFQSHTRWYYILMSITLALPMAMVGIRSLAETDWNPESALVSQLTFAAVIPHSNRNGVIINLISAAIAQAGANQSGDIAYDFKIGHLLGAPPDAQIYGHVFGSILGALISCSMYRLYASHYPIPGPLFPIPSSYLVLSTARLLMGENLPEGVAPFATATFIIFVFGTIVKMRYSHTRWQNIIPSGMSVAFGIYLPPSFSIMRVFGGLFVWLYQRRRPHSHGNLIIIASGLVLGESLASLVNLGLTALRVPQLGVGSAG